MTQPNPLKFSVVADLFPLGLSILTLVLLTFLLVSFYSVLTHVSLLSDADRSPFARAQISP